MGKENEGEPTIKSSKFYEIVLSIIGTLIIALTLMYSCFASNDRVDGVEKQIEYHDKRFDKLESKIDSLPDKNFILQVLGKTKGN